MKNMILAVVVCLMLMATVSAADSNDDVLGQILSEVGFSRADLGYRPAGYWNRFPLDVAHKLTSFDALFSEPLKLYDYATVMSATVETYLAPAYADSMNDGLYKLLYNLGVDKKLGGFRSYSANLLPAPESSTPIADAVERLFFMAGQSLNRSTFGADEYPSALRQSIIEQTEILPDSIKSVIGKLIINLGDAIKWRNLAFRNCDRSDMERAFRIRDLAQTQTDGQVYYPELDDIAATIDLASLHYAALKVAAAMEEAEAELLRLVDTAPASFEIEIASPFGKILILSKRYSKRAAGSSSELFSSMKPSIPGWYELDADNTLCVIDFGRNSIYKGSAGATHSLSNPVSVVLDLGGDDYYGYDKKEHSPNGGVGLLGIGMVLDSEGDDHYNGSIFSQGAGLFGVGVLMDRSGNDNYKASESAQGCGYFGIGLCLDGTGKDKFYIHGDGQGMGGVGGGVGVLACYDGNDEYIAEPFSKIFNRGDYHSEHSINGNNAQGAGFGRRGDGSDGHSWAGGLGAIIDIHGNDHYYSGNWTLGVGYWFATGIAIDKNGNDHYESCYFTQGSGAHYCNGILIDESGDDRHELYETAGAGLGFGWDYTNAFLINKGGNDIYRAKMISMGLSQIRSNAFLIDIGGDDQYFLGEGTPGLGEASYRRDFDYPRPLVPYNSYSKSFGGFIDIGGNDTYRSFKDGAESDHPVFRNNSMWLQPSRTDSTFGADNYGVGIDLEEGTIPELFKWE